MRILYPFILALIVLASCGKINTDEASVLMESNDQVILVGRLEITPSIEQYPLKGVLGPYRDAIEHRILTNLSTKPGNGRNPDSRSLLLDQSAQAIPLDRTFFITVPRAQIYLHPGVFMMSIPNGRNLGAEIYLPGGLTTASSATADIIYVGTIRYSRGDFMEITNVSVIDEFGTARGEIVHRFGADATIAKGLWVRFR